MDLSVDVAAIIKQAPEWNFAGDCALLELMKRISQNLEEHGERTSNKLNEFETSVRRADIALDNATNSLRSLQFGQQFVEYRVEEVDDDDFALPEEAPVPPPKSSQQLAQEFLQNNLQMLRKNFEPVTIEVPDSDDDEEGAVNTTTVFRAKNPYDGIPLPYIIGSKEWEQHKYAGLYDSAENSEDEQAEQFSSSSSDELEVADTPKLSVETPQLSDSSSLASVTRAPPSPPAAVTRPRPIISSRRNPHERDLFAALRASPPSDEPPSSSSSLNSSPAVSHRMGTGLPHVDASISSSSSRQTPPKLFDEPITVAAASIPSPVPAPIPTSASIPAPSPVKEQPVEKPQPIASQIKRKPVNLFNDDDFQSFMSEIVDKVQSKSGHKDSPKSSPSSTASAPAPKTVETPPIKTVNLFEDSPPVTPIPAQVVPKTLPKSMFDDNLEDDDDFLSSFATKAKPLPPVTKRNTLFDDDDDDLDIDDIFKSSPAPKTVPKLAKTSLFDDDDEEDGGDIFGAKVQEEKEPRLEQDKKKNQKMEQKKLLEQQKEEEQMQKELAEKMEQEMRKEQELREEQEKMQKELEDRRIKDQEQREKLERMKEQQEEQRKHQKQKEREERLKELEEKKEEERLKVQEEDQKKEQEQKEKRKEQEIMKQPEHDQEQSIATSLQRIRLFDDLDDDDLFGTPKTGMRVPAVHEEPPDDDVLETSPIKESHKETAKEQMAERPLNTLPKVKLFDDEFSDDEPTVKPTEAIGTTEPQEIKEAMLPSAQTEPKEKAAEEDVKPQSAAVFDDLFDDFSESPADQDPIMSLVADVSSKQKSTEPPREADMAAAQQIVQNYTSLFSDEPPDDSEFFQSLGSSSLNSLTTSKMFDNEHDFFEPSLPDIPSKAAAESMEQSTQDYGGMRLFSDVPPEDLGDQQATVKPPPVVGAATKRIHTIFYDDFSETARASADAVDRSSTKPVSPVKKLQMPNIKINVQALLPGAGMLPKQLKQERKEQGLEGEAEEEKQVKQKEERVEQREEPSHIKEKTAEQTVKSSSADGDNILQCISKTRARGPARRPSTRRARKENYAKSLQEDQAVATPKEASEPSRQVPPERKLEENSQHAVPVKQTPVRSAAFLESDDDDALFKQLPKATPAAPVPVTVAATTVPRPAPAAVPVSAAAPIPINVAALTPAPVALLHTQPPDDVAKSAAKPSKFVSFLDSEEEDSDFLFSSATAAPAAESSRKQASFLDSAEQSNQKSGLFSQMETKPAVATPVLPAVRPSDQKGTETQKVAKPTSFLDSDEDEDIFGAKGKPAMPKEPQPIPGQQRELKPAAAVSSAKELKSKPTVSSKLFDDSDDDADDLFGKATAPKSKPVKPKASLFADSDSEAEVQPKPLTVKAKLPAKSTKSLFSDDDDDDDLFGGGTKRAPASNQPKGQVAKPQQASNPPKSVVKTLPNTESSDNPLADLLNP